MLEPIRARCDRENSGTLPTQIVFVPHKLFGTFV